MLSSSRQPRAGVSRKLVLTAGSLAVALPLAAIALSGNGVAGAAVKHSKSHTTASCPTTGGIPFSGTLSNGTIKLGSTTSGSGLTGTVCGVLAAGASGLSVSIPQSDISFAPTHVTILGLASLPATVAAAGNGTGTASLNSDGSISTTLSVPVTSTVSALGFNCTVGPFTPVLTTGTSGSLTGSNLTGSGTLTGTLVAGEFSVPAIQPDRSCPFIVAGLVNLITGLPLKAGRSSLSATASLTLG